MRKIIEFKIGNLPAASSGKLNFGHGTEKGLRNYNLLFINIVDGSNRRSKCSENNSAPLTAFT